MARSLCEAELRAAGYDCRAEDFAFSKWPGQWGPPLAAAVQAGIVLAVARAARDGSASFALLQGVLLMTALLAVGALVKRKGTQRLPFQRTTATNLVATRGTPSVWLVAHLDTKSQTVPMLPRIIAVIALSAVTFVAAVMLALQLAAIGNMPPLWLLVALAAGLAALPSVVCLVTNESPGAADNASGVAAVLLAARALPRDEAVGVVITSGEELGLAGARVRADAAAPSETFINCDTIDDEGRWLCMYTGSRPRSLIAAAETSAARLGFNLSVRRLIPGILADSVAFSDRGCPSVTISRGRISTLARIHTRRDNSTATTGSGAAEASALLAAYVKELT